MAKDNLEDNINKEEIKKIVEKYHQQAKDKAREEGKTEKTQETYDRDPLATLKHAMDNYCEDRSKRLHRWCI